MAVWTAPKLAAKMPKEESLTGSGHPLFPRLYLFEAMWYCYESSYTKTAFSAFANPLMQWSIIIDCLMINRSFVSGINPTWSWPILFAVLLANILRFFTYIHKWNQMANFPRSYCLLKFCWVLLPHWDSRVVHVTLAVFVSGPGILFEDF